MRQTKANIKEEDLRKIDNFKFGISRQKTFSVLTQSLPRILEQKIIRKTRSKKRKLQITFMQEFEL